MHPAAIMFSVVFIICVSFLKERICSLRHSPERANLFRTKRIRPRLRRRAAEPEQWSDASRTHKTARSAFPTFGLWREIARSNQRRRRGRGKHERKSVSPDAVTGSMRFAAMPIKQSALAARLSTWPTWAKALTSEERLRSAGR